MTELEKRRPRRARVGVWLRSRPWAVLAQVAGAVLVAVGVALLFGVAWAVLAGGCGLFAAGSLAEAAGELQRAERRRRRAVRSAA